jgi:integrase
MTGCDGRAARFGPFARNTRVRHFAEVVAPPSWCRHIRPYVRPARAGDETIRSALASAAAAHLPDWPDDITPHVLRHFCASQLYASGMDLIAIQQLLGHAWIATTMNYVHVTGTHVEDAWLAGQQRAATRLEGLRR